MRSGGVACSDWPADVATRYFCKYSGFRFLCHRRTDWGPLPRRCPGLICLGPFGAGEPRGFKTRIQGSGVRGQDSGVRGQGTAVRTDCRTARLRGWRTPLGFAGDGLGTASPGLTCVKYVRKPQRGFTNGGSSVIGQSRSARVSRPRRKGRPKVSRGRRHRSSVVREIMRRS